MLGLVIALIIVIIFVVAFFYLKKCDQGQEGAVCKVWNWMFH